MPVSEPLLYKALTTQDLVAARDALWSKRMTGLHAVNYADNSGNTYKSDEEMAAALAAIDRELARRRGATVPTTILIGSEKGLE